MRRQPSVLRKVLGVIFLLIGITIAGTGLTTANTLTNPGPLPATVSSTQIRVDPPCNGQSQYSCLETQSWSGGLLSPMAAASFFGVSQYATCGLTAVWRTTLTSASQVPMYGTGNVGTRFVGGVVYASFSLNGFPGSYATYGPDDGCSSGGTSTTAISTTATSSTSSTSTSTTSTQDTTTAISTTVVTTTVTLTTTSTGPGSTQTSTVTSTLTSTSTSTTLLGGQSGNSLNFIETAAGIIFAILGVALLLL